MSSHVKTSPPSFRSLHIATSLRSVVNLAACSSLIPHQATQKKTVDTMSRRGWREGDRYSITSAKLRLLPLRLGAFRHINPVLPALLPEPLLFVETGQKSCYWQHWEALGFSSWRTCVTIPAISREIWRNLNFIVCLYTECRIRLECGFRRRFSVFAV